MAVTGTAAQHQVLCLLLWCNDTVCCHSVTLSFCHTVIAPANIPSLGDSEAQQQEVQLQQTTCSQRGESPARHPCLLNTELSRYSTHDTIRLTPDHVANEWFHTSYSSHYGVVQARV